MSATFTVNTWAFLDRLSTDNSKATFDAQRDTYRHDVAAASAAFVDALTTLLPARVHPDLRGEAKVGRSLFRINRDLRFATDKSPYKTHLDFLFWIGDGAPRTQPACIVRLTAREVLLGAGQAGLRGAALDRYRTRLDHPHDGAAIATIVTTRLGHGDTLSDPDRAKPPRPYPAEHRNAELLRRDGFHLTSTHPHPSTITTDTFAAWCAAQLAPYQCLLDWLTDADGQSSSTTLG